MSCNVCDMTAKYKCPTCRTPYCSAACCKKHKESPCSAPPPLDNSQDSPTESKHYDYPTEDTVPLEILQQLENSAGLKKCLENEHVRKILETLDKSPYPDELLQDYMQEPIFTEFVEECLKVVESEDKC